MEDSSYDFIDSVKIADKLKGVQYRCECIMNKNENSEVPLLCPDHWQAVRNYILECEDCGKIVSIKMKAWSKSRCDECQADRTKVRNSVAQKQRYRKVQEFGSDVVMRASRYKMTLAEVARELGLSVGRVEQIEKAAMAKFKENWMLLAAIPLLSDLLSLDECSFTVQREYLTVTRLGSNGDGSAQ